MLKEYADINKIEMILHAASTDLQKIKELQEIPFKKLFIQQHEEFLAEIAARLLVDHINNGRALDKVIISNCCIKEHFLIQT